MAWTQADADRIKAAIATGARRVKVGERDTELRGLPEMERTLKLIENELDSASGRRRVKFFQFSTDKGIR